LNKNAYIVPLCGKGYDIFYYINAIIMKTIHIFIHTLNHSGLVHAAVMMANGLVDKGYKSKLVVIGQGCESPYNIDERINLTFLNVKRGKGLLGKIRYLLQSIIALRKYIKARRAENLLVWGNEFTSVAVFIRCLFGFNAKIIGVNATSISSHLKSNKGFYTAVIHKKIYKTFLNRADHIIAQSAGMVNELVEVFTINKEKLNVAYPAISKKFFGLEITGIKEDEIIYVGRLIYSKNVERLLTAFSKIKDKDVKLRIIGEGELIDSLKHMSEELGIKDRVIFEGAMDNVVPYMQKAKLLVLTSRYEGFGMVVAEAIACGTPAVAVDCPVGPSEIIINGENGYLADYENDEELVSLIDKALQKKWDYKNVSKTVDKFSPENVLPEYINAIKKVF